LIAAGSTMANAASHVNAYVYKSNLWILFM